ncbi:MAG: YfhO family protein [Chitinophagaceae bacterium]
MKNFSWKNITPHAIAVAIFLVITLIYCKPALQGKVLQQQDIVQWLAMSKDQQNVQDKTGKIPLWSNGMFSGMPGYLIKGDTNNLLPFYFINIVTLWMPKPICFFFLACICFYFLSQVLRVNSWVGIMGALCYAYATFNPVIIVAGHDTQMFSIALLPGFIVSLFLIYDGKYWSGTALTALFTSALISQNHYQTMYYAVIIAVFMTIGYVVKWLMQKQWKHLFIAAALVIVAAAIGILSNAVVLFTNYEYAQESIRGGSDLGDEHATKTGLTQDYAFSYSMYKSEPFVMLVPRMFGGSSSPTEIPEEKSKMVEALQNIPQQLGQQMQNLGLLSYYWGGIGDTSGPPYIGAIICFLAILGFVILDNKNKWWILAACIITIIMSWGGYAPGFNGWLLNNLPGYNKFRAPSFIILVPTILLGIMAILSLNKILFEVNDKALLWKQFKKALLITGGIFVLLLVMYLSFDYQSTGDQNVLHQLSSLPNEMQSAVRTFFNALIEDRKSLFIDDIFRSLIFIAIAAAAIWAYLKNKLKPITATIIIAVFAFIDVMVIDAHYLSSDNYVDKDDYDTNFQPTAADLQIMKDTSFYRVLDLTHGGIQGAFNQGAMTSYFHKSIGGYHPAKLSIYQDLIEKQLYHFPNCLPVLNMLNTKYIIGGQDPQHPQAQQNPGALGDVWFVKGVRFVNGSKAEMDALTYFNPKDTAIVQQSFSNIIKSNFTVDTTATINLIKNENDVVTYHSKSSREQPAVFSEIYYDKGWNVYVDGKKVSYAKVDYVLRGMMVPAGEHTIVFKFEPASHKIGWQLTSICSIILLLLIIAAIALEVRKRRKLNSV